MCLWQLCITQIWLCTWRTKRWQVVWNLERIHDGFHCRDDNKTRLRHKHERLSVTRKSMLNAKNSPSPFTKVTNDIHTSSWCNHTDVQIVACQFQDSKTYLWAVTLHPYSLRSVFKFDKGTLSRLLSYLYRCQSHSVFSSNNISRSRSLK